MTQHYEVTVRYDKIMEDGMTKKVSEKYLVGAVSFSDAEERMAVEADVLSSGEFEIVDIKKAKFAEIFKSQSRDTEKHYSCQLEFVTLDEKSGKEKKTKYNVLVEACSLSDAMKQLNEGMKGTMADYNALSIKQTNIVEVWD